MATSPITTTSTHLPGQLYEVAQALESAEQALAPSVNPANVQVTLNSNTGKVTITATLPVTMVHTADGATYKATDYIAALST